MKKILLLIALSQICSFLSADVLKVEPANWWVGMNDSSLQVLVYGENIASTHPVALSEEIEIDRVVRVSNPNYLFLYLEIPESTPTGKYTIEFSREGEVVDSIEYPLWERQAGADQIAGFDRSDVIYLLMPDRFANGDPNNDVIETLEEKTIDRMDPYARHGGDLQGVIDHLDYLQELGVTALWLNPVLENNSPEFSYHGYGITDFYQVDARYGSNELYLELADKARAKGMKIVMDMIFNHCGIGHWWMKDLPCEDWVNAPNDIRITNHKRTTNLDPYAAAVDTDLNRRGWFTAEMPDLNLENPLMEHYLIQNSIWWIEYLGLGGIRMDTHPYPDKYAMSRWAKRIMEEYPNFNLTGEEWTVNPAIVSYWQEGKENWDGYEGNMPSMLDFPLQDAIKRAFQEEENWGSGLIVLYEMLANDMLYPDPNNLVTFLGNHDMARFYMEVGQDLDWYKNGLAYLLTTRGIPHLYYGDEVLMSHVEGNDHGNIRKDFPGGWNNDAKDVFLEKNLNLDERSALDYTRKLLNWRKNATVIHKGELTHFAPENNSYVLFRYDDTNTVMVVLNKNEAEFELDLGRFEQFLAGKQQLKNVISGEVFSIDQALILKPKQPGVFEVQ